MNTTDVSRPLCLPQREGAYRWYYLDFTSEELTCVVIFMLGPLFSSRYPAAKAKLFPPLVCCAVNVALYARGRRHRWVLSEYPGANLSPDGRLLELGHSSLTALPSGGWQVAVDEKTVSGKRVSLEMEIEPSSFPPTPPLSLWDEGPHRWQPLSPRATATLRFEGTRQSGLAYVDTNDGDAPLGLGVGRWCWGRVHGPQRTLLYYQPEHGRGFVWDVSESTGARPLGEGGTIEKTPWWKLPFTRLPLVNRRPSLLEWTPFYARLESRRPDAHALFEIADFAAFQHPVCLWMAKWRTRVEPLALSSGLAWG